MYKELRFYLYLTNSKITARQKDSTRLELMIAIHFLSY